MLGSKMRKLVGGDDVRSGGKERWRGHRRAGRVTDSGETAAGLCVHCVWAGRSK